MKSKTFEEIGCLSIATLVLTIYVLGALVIDTVFTLSEETSKLINYIDIFICIFFFFEFCLRLIKSKNKLKFMRWGWIDLISSVPMITVLRLGRIFRLLRIIRIIRAFRSLREFISYIFRNKAQGALTTASLIAILIVFFSAIAILQVENTELSNIKSAEDALWWSFVTITSVGYGDKFPVTTEGRIIAAFLMTAGAGLFGTFTAYIASIFIKDNKFEIKNED